MIEILSHGSSEGSEIRLKQCLQTLMTKTHSKKYILCHNPKYIRTCIKAGQVLLNDLPLLLAVQSEIFSYFSFFKKCYLQPIELILVKALFAIINSPTSHNLQFEKLQCRAGFLSLTTTNILGLIILVERGLPCSQQGVNLHHSPQDIWQWLETFLVVTPGSTASIWWVEAVDAAKNLAIHREALHKRELSKVSEVPTLRNSGLE